MNAENKDAPSVSTRTLFFLVAVLPLFAGVAISGVMRAESRASQMLDQWLRDNDFQLLQKSTPWRKDNSFFATSNRGQKVFKVTVRDKVGQILVGWLRCGHALAGVAVPQIEVKWDKTATDDEQAQPRDRVLPPP